jgi:hypothetical protein
MGSVAVLTTSGDNDSELEPVQSYRHYLYCDACGRFELEPWEARDVAVERRQRRLGLAALWATPLLVVPAWQAAGFAVSLAVLLYVAIGFALGIVVWVIVSPQVERFAAIGRVLRWGLPWLVALVLAEELCAALPDAAVAGVGALLVVGALAWRAALPPWHQSLGLRCRNCAATYGHRTAFFNDLDANPRGLTASDVPRPLGRTEFRVGRYVGPAPP